MAPKILFLSDNFPPESNAPANRTYEHCKYLVDSGFDVTVVTCFPNYPKGETFAGYNQRLWAKENIDGITCYRVMTYMAPNAGFWRRSFDHLSFGISSFMVSIFLPTPDVIIGTSPQFFTVVSARLLSSFKRCPWVFELRDMWPDSLDAVGLSRNRYLLNLIKALEHHLYRDANRIISVTESFKQILVSRGIAEDKISVIRNGVDLNKFVPREKNKQLASCLGLEGKFTLGYIGTVGMAHGLEVLLDVADLIEARSQLMILVVGDGASRDTVRQQAEERGIDNIIFIDSVDRDVIVDYWSLVDVTLVHLRKSDVFKSVIPSKIFEAVAMQIPLIMAVEGESAQIVADFGLGSIVSPENAAEITGSFLELYENQELLDRYRTNCAESRHFFDRRALAEKLLQELVSVNATNQRSQL